MKREYESWEEVAADFTDGNCVTHLLDDHSSEECLGWQEGVQSLCRYLDEKRIPPPDHDKVWS